MGKKKDEDQAYLIVGGEEVPEVVPEPEAEPEAAPEAAPEPEPERELRQFAELANPPEPTDLLDAIEGAETVELAMFGPAGAELPLPLRPVDRTEEPWGLTAGRLQPILKTWQVTPAAGGPAHELVGYALIVDGEHVASAARPEPLRLAGGVTYDLTDDVIFA